MPGVSLSIWQALQEHALLPPASTFVCRDLEVGCRDLEIDVCPDLAIDAADLLPALIRVWERAIADTDRPPLKRAERAMLARLQRAREAGAILSLGVAGAEPWFDTSVGERLIWWPRGVPQGERVAVISSRLGRWSKLPPHWFVTLRHVFESIDPAQQTLVSARETALEELVERWAGARQVPLLMFDVTTPRQSLRRWWSDCLHTATGLRSEMPWKFPALVSPPLLASQPTPIPVRDAVLVAVSDQVVVCQVRPQGNVWRLLEQRLARDANSICRTATILAGPGFTSDQAADSLRRRGARVQTVFADNATRNPEPQGRTTCGTRCGDEAELILAPPEYPYLVHCTRAIDGPWPDQDRGDYLDELLFGGTDPVRTPLTTLARIVGTQTLLATGRAIRGRFPVVCFTSVPLVDLPALRTFRAHRGRWDFEPYGIAIRRDWLLARGTRAVIYGDDSVWENMDETTRPFFQRRFSGSGRVVDWSIEQEWRNVGTLDLHDLPANAAFVFVPTLAAATVLRPISRWPVLILTPS